jgi:hypothetical protein
MSGLRLSKRACRQPSPEPSRTVFAVNLLVIAHLHVQETEQARA